MYNGIRAQGGVASGGAIYSVYFVLVMLFGNCILSIRLTGACCLSVLVKKGTDVGKSFD